MKIFCSFDRKEVLVNIPNIKKNLPISLFISALEYLNEDKKENIKNKIIKKIAEPRIILNF